MLTAAPDDRKLPLKEEKYNSTNFQTLWDFEGVFKYSPLFYGWYTHKEWNWSGYRMPLAYFITGLVAYAYSFLAILRKMAENSRMSKLSEKDDECIFSWKLFTAWDYMIGNAETAHNRIASIVVGFKEALLEEAEKKREARNWKILAFRILVNTVVLGLLFFSAFAVVLVVQRSKEPEARSSVWRSNEITFVMTFISISFPMIFEGLGFLEQYHPRKQLRLQLARIMVLNLLNLYSLIFALFDKINDMTRDLESFERNLNKTSLQVNSAVTHCYNICYTQPDTLKALNLIAVVATNVSSTMYPIMQKALKKSTTEADNATTEAEFTASTAFPGMYASSTYLEENDTDEILRNVENFAKYEDFLSNATGSSSDPDYRDYYDDSNKFLNLSEASTDDFSPSPSPNASPGPSTGLDPDPSFAPTSSSSTSPSPSTSSSPSPSPSTSSSPSPHSSPLVEKRTTQHTTNIVETSTTTKSRKTLCERKCQNTTIPAEDLTSVSNVDESSLNYTTRRKLRNLCWETMFGQELIKLTVMDLVMTILSTLAMDFFRAIFIRVMNKCWCWDLEKKFPQYADFKVAENILHLVNNQGMVWMGMFFSPGLVALNVVKLLVLMYFRAWTVLTCNVPHEIIFRASRSNNFYYALLLMMLFLCVLPVGYAIVRIPPSFHCGPFSNYPRIFHILTKTIKRNVPQIIEDVLDYIASPGIIIPLLLLLVLIIYYLISLTGALREANTDLKIQLRRERTEERRKMFQMADKRRKGVLGSSGEFSNTPFAKWKKLLGEMPNAGKSFDTTSPRQESSEIPAIKEEKMEVTKSKDLFSKFIKKALRKTSTSDEDNHETQRDEDGTDTEQHESLPEDLVSIKESRTPQLSKFAGSFDYPKTLLQKRNSQKSVSESSDKQFKEARPVPTKKEMRQDSSCSVWSDNIPVITISKTESAECLDVVPELTKVEASEKSPKTDTKFKPKIKCALKKQSTEIDEDVICHFSKDLDLTPKVFDFEEKDLGVVSESSEDTRESSTDTVLAAKPEQSKKKEKEKKKNESGVAETSSANGSATESSAEYNDITSL